MSATLIATAKFSTMTSTWTEELYMDVLRDGSIELSSEFMDDDGNFDEDVTQSADSTAVFKPGEFEDARNWLESYFEYAQVENLSAVLAKIEAALRTST